MPGVATGVTLPRLMIPALPEEVPAPGASGSTSVTSQPSRWRKRAQLVPTMPAPMMRAEVNLPSRRHNVAPRPQAEAQDQQQDAEQERVGAEPPGQHDRARRRGSEQHHAPDDRQDAAEQ